MQFIRSKEETWPDWIVRQGVRSIARVGEGLFGAPGNIKDFMKDLIISQYENASLVGDPTDFGKKQREAPNWLKYALGEYDTGTMGLDLPTTQEIKETGQELADATGNPGYLDPKNYAAEKFDEVLTDFGSTLFPGGAGRNFLQKIGFSVAANAGEELVGLLGGTEKQKTGAKLGCCSNGCCPG